MLQTGKIIEAEIIDLNYMALGVAKIDNFVVFVHGAVPGDILRIKITEVKKNYAIGEIIEIIKQSDYRVSPVCPHYEQCGGCQLMHMDYGEQLKFKKSRVINELRRAGIDFNDAEVHDTIGMDSPFRYRNKTAFSVKEKAGEIIIGPYEQGTYNIVNIDSCLIQSSEADEAIALFKKLMIKHNIKAYDKKTGKGTIKNVLIRNNRKNELMFIIVTASENFKFGEAFIKELTGENPNIKTVVQNINSKNTNLVMGRKNLVLYGDGTINDKIDDLNFTISPETFFQVNPAQTEKLYNTAIKYANLQEDEVCFDIYCGIGTISLMAARHAKKVYGIEIVEQSIVNAKENAIKNNITNTEFYAGKAEKTVPKLYRQNIKADTVIVDPPRKGCEQEVISTITSMSPRKIVYVSCNPSTLARDIKLLEAGGYKLKEVQPVDMFPWSVHVESIILMTYCGSKSKK